MTGVYGILRRYAPQNDIWRILSRQVGTGCCERDFYWDTLVVDCYNYLWDSFPTGRDRLLSSL